MTCTWLHILVTPAIALQAPYQLIGHLGGDSIRFITLLEILPTKRSPPASFVAIPNQSFPLFILFLALFMQICFTKV